MFADLVVIDLNHQLAVAGFNVDWLPDMAHATDYLRHFQLGAGND